jgi:hypothetical protein
MALLGQLKAVAPHPPPGATILTFGEPGYVAEGVPVFGASWDLNGAVRMQYDRSDLAGYPILPMARLSCGPRALRIGGAGYELAAPAPYGRAVLVDVPNGHTAQPRTRAACARAVAALRPGPLIGSAWALAEWTSTWVPASRSRRAPTGRWRSRRSASAR